MSNELNVVDNLLIASCAAIGISSVDEFLGIVNLTLSAVWLLTKLIVRVYNTVKHGENLDNLNEDVDAVTDKIEDIAEALKGEEDKPE